MESDGRGVAPPGVRALLLEQDGVWELEIADLPSAPLLIALRAVLDLSLTEVSSLKGHLPGVAVTGTEVELLYFQSFLKNRGFESVVRRRS